MSTAMRVGAEALGLEAAGDRLDDKLVLAGLLHHQPGDAARGVAAGLGVRPVAVPDAHEDVAAQGRFHGDDLVGAGACGGVGDGLDLFGLEAEVLLPSVQYDEGVPGPIHLPELHGGRCKGVGERALGSEWRVASSE